MLRRVLSLSLVAGAVAIPACATSTALPHVAVATNLTLPRGVLDKVTKITLTVLEGTVSCDATLGQIAFPSGADAAKELKSQTLGTTGCGAGVRFCGDVTIDKSDAVRVFSAVAKGAGHRVPGRAAAHHQDVPLHRPSELR
jgi:hypothetical protein